LTVDVGRVGRAGRGTGLVAGEAADDGAFLSVVEIVIASASRDSEHLRDDVEIHGHERRPLRVAALDVVEEGDVVAADRVWVVEIRVPDRPDVRQAPELHRGGAGRQGLVQPVELIVDPQVLPEQAADAAQAPAVRRAKTHLVALMRIAQSLVPGRGGGKTRGSQAGGGGTKLVIIPGKSRG